MKSAILKFVSQSKNYAFVIGVICFAIGILGFIFKASTSLSSFTLLVFVVLGVWGILVAVREKFN